MHITVRLFASHRETLGKSSLSAELPEGSTAAAALERLSALHPGLAATAGPIAFAVNRQHAAPDTRLHDGDELALLPPVAGG